MTDYVIRRDEVGVHLEQDGAPVRPAGGIERVEVRRGFGLERRIKIFSQFGDTISIELQLGDTVRHEGRETQRG